MLVGLWRRNGRRGLAKVGDDGSDLERRVITEKGSAALVEDPGIDIERYVVQLIVPAKHGLDEKTRLAGVAAAELDHASARREGAHDLLRKRSQNLRLGASDVVLGKLADGLEQSRAKGVVEVLRRKRFR